MTNSPIDADQASAPVNMPELIHCIRTMREGAAKLLAGAIAGERAAGGDKALKSRLNLAAFHAQEIGWRIDAIARHLDPAKAKGVYDV